MSERRKGDRRRYDQRPRFPLVDSDGNLITANRRRVVERRYRQDSEGAEAPQQVASGAAAPAERGDSRLVLRLSGREIELDDTVNGFVVGRHSGSDLRAESRAVSRRHLLIAWEGGRFVITDQSSNGTYITGTDGTNHHLLGESLALAGSGEMYLGLPPEDPTAVRLSYTVSPPA